MLLIFLKKFMIMRSFDGKKKCVGIRKKRKRDVYEKVEVVKKNQEGILDLSQRDSQKEKVLLLSPRATKKKKKKT